MPLSQFHHKQAKVADVVSSPAIRGVVVFKLHAHAPSVIIDQISVILVYLVTHIQVSI